jgi:hypothetical protein
MNRRDCHIPEWRNFVKSTLLVATILAFCLANSAAQGKLLTSDPLTGLPLNPATDSGMHYGNEPRELPGSQICKNKKQAEFYTLYNIKVDAAVAWYSTHLPSFKKAQGYDSSRSQTAFYNSDGTIVIFVTGDSGALGENTNAYSVAYERFQPGLSEKTITSVTQGKIVCQ